MRRPTDEEEPMAKRCLFILCICSAVFIIFRSRPVGAAAQQESVEPHIHVVVDMVQLNVAVTDKKGSYITGLKPEDFIVTEDGIPQKIATFGEGNEPTRRLLDPPAPETKTAASGSAGDPADMGSQGDVGQRVSGGDLTGLVTGANVFVLFDTTNDMYRGFVCAQDAIADFVRSLDHANRVAFYSYSRDLSRASSLTDD